MVRVCPHSDAICPNGMACAFSCATAEYDGTKRPTADKASTPAGGLVERLKGRRAFGQLPGTYRWFEFDQPDEDCAEAAAEITRLQAELDEARELLEPFAATGAVLDAKLKDSAVWAGQTPAPPITFGHLRAARAFLTRTEKRHG